MRKAAISGLWSMVFLGLLSSGGCQRSTSVNEDLLQLDEGTFELAGPFVHENLAVFLLTSDQEDDRDFITLDQGLKDGVVKVNEQGRAQVSQLEIDNQSDHYLFLQEGDRVVGGQQDRIITTSLVVPPKSGKMPLPSFCVESGRWVGSRAFHGSYNAALAPKQVRQASKEANDQQQVWQSVGRVKVAAQTDAALNAPNTNSSLNETLDSPQVKRLSDECAAALKDVLDEHPHAVGVAIVLNGEIEEVNIYPNHKVLDRLYPRLLQSYALQAALSKDKAEADKPVTSADIRSFMTERKEQAESSKRDVNGDNKLHLCVSDKKVECETVYSGKVVHRQWLSKEEVSNAREQPAGSGDRQMREPAQAPNAPANDTQRQRPAQAPKN